MRKADVVIGAGYGDEGKGLMTDYLASQYDESIVIRFNGGAQAGHTVQTDTMGHVFSHFSSGSFANAHTYLSEFFIVNPIAFIREGVKLEMLVKPPKVTIHPDAMVTTPFDMIINQVMAKSNTCGMGINETIVRHEAGYQFTARLLKLSKAQIRVALELIRDEYMPKRLEQLGLTLSDEYRNVMMSEGVIEAYLNDCAGLAGYCTIGRLKPVNIPIIFEGAQGLLLDKDFDPTGTPTKTGLANVISIAKSLEIDHLDVNYMIRAYMTRHGDGPFPTENPSMKYEDITNVPNKFQGALRQGMFNLDMVHPAIQVDRERSKELKTQTRLVVTHLDQMPSYIEFIDGGKVCTYKREDFARQIGLVTTGRYAESWGPTRKDIRCHTPSK